MYYIYIYFYYIILYYILFYYIYFFFYSIERFVKNELLHKISAIIKRSWLDENQIIKNDCFSKIFQLIENENSMVKKMFYIYFIIIFINIY